MKIRFHWPGRSLYVKRDDMTGSTLSGNKVRKLEYLIADARRCGADTLITCGAVQSNCARALALAAAQRGFRSVLVLTGGEPAETDGNLLLSRIVGSDIHFLPPMGPAERDAAMRGITQRLRRDGFRPYEVPFGGSSEVGVLGHVRAAFELRAQLARIGGRIGHIVTPMASGGTYAGLFIGCRLAGMALRPIGAFVDGTARQWVPDLVDLIRRTSRRFDLDVAVSERDIDVLDARGEGYGCPSEAELEFIVRFARRTGVILDPVYVGKAMFHLDCAVREGRYSDGGDMLFLHTGGVFGIYPHRLELCRALRSDEPSGGLWSGVPDPRFGRAATAL